MTAARVEPGEQLRRLVPSPAIGSDGLPTSGAFQPTKHDGMMSTFRETVAAEAAFGRWEGTADLAGVWPVEVQMCADNGLDVLDDAGQPCACENDPDCDYEYPPGHASVDYRPIGRKERERIYRRLKQRAIEIGPLFTA